jgi:hypothetical protein
MSEGLSVSVRVAEETKRVRGDVLGFFSGIKQEKRSKLLFFCSRCGKHLLLNDRSEIREHRRSCAGILRRVRS